MEIQLELTRRGIPFEVTSGLRFFEQAHVKDVAAFLKFAVNPSDETAFRRMVRLLPGVGEKTADTLWSVVRAGVESPAPFGEILRRAKPPARAAKIWEQLAATLDEIAPERKPVAPDRAIDSIMEAFYEDYMKAEFANFENRREDLRTLAGYSRQFTSTDEFLAQLALLTNVDGAGSRRDTETDRVVLSSVHQAKGLEWRAVFVIWLSEGMFPASRKSGVCSTWPSRADAITCIFVTRKSASAAATANPSNAARASSPKFPPTCWKSPAPTRRREPPRPSPPKNPANATGGISVPADAGTQ
jgi:DNA helicase-2/ATP-dependent DNA helicase PcrA